MMDCYAAAQKQHAVLLLAQASIWLWIHTACEASCYSGYLIKKKIPISLYKKKNKSNFKNVTWPNGFAGAKMNNTGHSDKTWYATLLSSRYFPLNVVHTVS